MKKRFIEDLQFGESLFDEQFAVKEIKKGKTHDNRDYLDLVMVDKTGEIMGKVWADDIENCLVQIGDIAAVNATVVEFRDKQQLRISSAQPLTEYDVANFLPASDKDIPALMTQIDSAIATVSNKHWRSLLDSFYADEEFRKIFLQAPAAEKIHHAYLGGMVEHTAEMLNLTEVLLQHYPDLDRELLITGVLLHDIGKLEELALNHVIYRTLAGSLLQHISLGLITVNDHLKKIKSFPPELKSKILHLILSHHGQLEFGSPVKPMLPEAIALSLLDNLSAKVNTVCGVVKNLSESGLDFSDYNYYLETKLYLK